MYNRIIMEWNIMEIVKPNRIVDRSEDIVSWFVSGKAITEIARLLSESIGTVVSYQAVHRILKQRNLTRKDGGKSVQTTAKNKELVEAKIQKLDDRYGCTEEQYQFLRGMSEVYKDTPLASFNTFKNNLKNLYPDIQFELTLWDWWTIWDESKRWDQRKRNPKGLYVMTFIDQKQIFNKANARIMAFSDLLKEQRAPKVTESEISEDLELCEAI